MKNDIEMRLLTPNNVPAQKKANNSFIKRPVEYKET